MVPSMIGAQERSDSTETILRRFAEDYRSDPTARTGKFGFEVDGERWHVSVERRDAAPASVILLPGFPAEPIFYFATDRETLVKLDRGMTGETATARARAEDPYPLRTRTTEGFPRYLINDQFDRFVERLRLHFFSRGRPEIIPLALEHSRVSHDVQVVGLVYRPGLRTVWGAILPGQHANRGPEDSGNPWDTLLVGMKGTCSGRVGGVDVMIRANEVILIPAQATHEFWNTGSESCEFLLVMYGEGA